MLGLPAVRAAPADALLAQMEGLDLERRQCVAADEVARKEKLERGMKRRTVAIATKSTQIHISM